jgi:hypothetical protein
MLEWYWNCFNDEDMDIILLCPICADILLAEPCYDEDILWVYDVTYLRICCSICNYIDDGFSDY